MSKNNTIALLILLVIVLFVTACAKLSSRVMPNTDFSQYGSYFVELHDRDNRHIDEIIRDEMILLGYKTKSGTIGDKPQNVDVIVTYEDRWAWDMTNYMLSLTVDFRDARNNVLLATGHSYRPSLERKSPQEMAREVIASIMKKTNTSKDVASIPKEMTAVPSSAAITEVSLRKKPKKIRMEKEINNMLVKYGFFDDFRNPLGSFDNDFVDNNDGTVTDKATGLMWQKSGSSRFLENRYVKRYINQLNKKQFAGRSDWRMPTVEELASLLKKDKTIGVHMDSVFDNKQIRCWTIDSCDAVDYHYLGAWIVDFKQGTIRGAWYGKSGGEGGRYRKYPINYLKAVCSVK